VCDETDEPVAIGFTSMVALSAPDQSGQSQTWQEHRVVVRSWAFAASQEKHVRHRVACAVAAINALDVRKQGKQRLPDEAAASHIAATISAHDRVEGLVHVRVTTAVHEYVKRRYGTRPATTVRRERVHLDAAREEATLAQTVRRLGWRVYATHHTAEALSLAQGVAA
jgi:transposase